MIKCDLCSDQATDFAVVKEKRVACCDKCYYGKIQPYEEEESED